LEEAPPEDCGFAIRCLIAIRTYPKRMFRETASAPLTHSMACQFEKDPNLILLVELWDRLPEPVRAGIVAMVKASAASDKV